LPDAIAIASRVCIGIDVEAYASIAAGAIEAEVIIGSVPDVNAPERCVLM
jgi:hypothetical protein